MSLFVQTARISYRGGWRLDVTRKSGTEGLFLAPSWTILRPALEARKRADALLEETMGLDATARAAADDWISTSWAVYTLAYLAEMRASLKANLPQWRALFVRHRVVLVCYCTDAERCHRQILRTRVLPALGAVDGGELPS
jgi:hypothetical protein